MYLFRLRDHKTVGGYYLFSIYLCIVYLLTGSPNITYFRWDPNITFVPVIGMADDLRSTLLNIALFLPLGIGLPLLWKQYDSFCKTVFWESTISLCIEIAQLFTYRTTDINDLITNVTGTILGYLVFKLFLSKRYTHMEIGLPVLLTICFAVMFLGAPLVHKVLNKLCSCFCA